MVFVGHWGPEVPEDQQHVGYVVQLLLHKYLVSLFKTLLPTRRSCHILQFSRQLLRIESIGTPKE